MVSGQDDLSKVTARTAIIEEQTMDNEKTLNYVRTRYAGVADSELSGSSEAVRAIAVAFGYSDQELAQLPEEANMGLSCGNPLALAGVRPGEVVLDLGCGGGMDVFLAARQVGETGKAIGVDMTSEMLERAKAGQQKLGLTNVEFHQATIDKLPLADNSVDCVISNCVINLVPDKQAVFREILRVLKPGGRIAISDIALKQELPAEVRSNLDAYVGCISGAILLSEYRRLLEEAGFGAVVIQDTGANLNAYAQAGSDCCSSATAAPSCCSDAKSDAAGQSSFHDDLSTVMRLFDANAYAASVRVHGLKPDGTSSLPDDPSSGKHTPMKTIQVYDPPMCCSTGVCGPQVDPILPRFTADLDWLKSQGHRVERYNLAQQPQAFIDNPRVHQLISEEGTDCLPLIMVEGTLVSRSNYPTRETMATWIDATGVPAEAMSLLPIANQAGGCCGDSGCC
jgi:SAM-dependent methyltransferase